MSTLIERVTDYDNLCWAWLKAKRMNEMDDILTDDLAVANFEINLRESLHSIAKDLRDGNYRLRPLIPMAHPKGADDSGNHRIRQSFNVAVRDQVAWIALVNIIGPGIEKRMPHWSYGNRLYRQMFFEPGPDDTKHLRFGNFRHAKGELYRPFHQAWPVYRRHILFTARHMTGNKIVLDERDRELLEVERCAERLQYLHKGWWKASHREAYWATIDLKQFYQSVRLESVCANLCTYSNYPRESVKEVVGQLSVFPLSKTDWPDEVLQIVGLSPSQKTLTGIPTGLFVSGFLANAAMLGIDTAVEGQLQKKQVAQFRYVDDHTVLAPTFEALTSWLEEYVRMIKDAGLGVEINAEKTEPEALRNYLTSLGSETETQCLIKAKTDTRIDTRVPTPLLTKTLAKVSVIAATQVDLQTVEEQDALLADIEQLLLTEFPPEELRPDTRMSFAMSQLCKVAAKRYLQSKETWEAECEVAQFIDEFQGKERPESSKLRNLQLNRDRKIEDQFKHLFELLELTIERYPDRPRLWAKALRFCLRTGYAAGLERLVDLLSKVTDIHDLSRRYIHSFVLQRINRYFLEAISTILSPDTPLCERSAAVRFAGACCSYGETACRKTEEQFNVLKLYSECRMAYRFLGHVAKSRNCASYDLEEVHVFLYHQGLLITLPDRAHPSSRLPPTDHDAVCARWHIDARITPFAADRPSYYWRSIAPRLSPSQYAGGQFLAKWPSFLPARSRESFTRQFRLATPGRTGWYVDMLAGASGHTPKAGNSLGKKLLLAPPDSVSHISLDTWIHFASDLAPWDPRRSEWTALEIVRQALSSRLSFASQKSGRVPIVPQNILVPMEWQNVPDDQQFHTWESWGRTVTKCEAGVRLRITQPIADERYSLHAPSFESDSEPWDDVYATGLVLLGLLRLSFHLPSMWNAEGQVRLWTSGMARIASELACSSWTLAILQATVLPRNRETFMLYRLDQAQLCQHDDTVNDPPMVNNVDMLQLLVSHAQRILERYRVTVQNHNPRQLVPQSMDQIGRALFGSSGEDGNI